MAALGLTRGEIAEAAQTLPVGSSVRGFTLAARTQHRGGGHHWTVTVTKGQGTWTCEYLRHDVDPYGRVVKIVDEDGRRWFVDPTGTGWIDGGI